MMAAFGRRLRDSRIARGFSKMDVFADCLGSKYQAYGKYERGTSYPPPAVLRDICNVLGVTADFLLFGRSDQPSNGETVQLGEQPPVKPFDNRVRTTDKRGSGLGRKPVDLAELQALTAGMTVGTEAATLVRDMRDGDRY